MKENETKHTFIVAIDAASMITCMVNPAAMILVQNFLVTIGMEKSDAIHRSGKGLIYQKVIES